MSGTTCGATPRIGYAARAARQKKFAGKQRHDAAEAREDAPRLRVDRLLAIDPRANFSGGPHETVTALAAASCANFPWTALPLAGEVCAYGNLRDTRMGEGFARMRAMMNR